MKRRIQYIPKITSARTNYREISVEDMAWLQQELIRWTSLMAEVGVAHDEDSKFINDQFWHKRTTSLPRGKEGNNSPCSFVGGLINNLVFGEQRDLSDKQMDGIAYVSAIMAAALDTCTGVQFQVGFL
jgi:hypothetical protein